MIVATRVLRTGVARRAGSPLPTLLRCLASSQIPPQAPVFGHPLVLRAMRPQSTYQFSSAYDDVWPQSVTNTVLNVCPQGERFVVERLGKLLDIKPSGWFLAIPYVDRIAYRIDMRERAMAIAPQSAITKDNVSVDVAGILYIQFVDPEKAAYGSSNPLYAVRQCAQSAMRAAMGELELDEILHARAKVNSMVKNNVQEAATQWGLEVKRYEITEVRPDKSITLAMDKQAAAERNRREAVIKAEGEKRSQELKSEGIKISLQNESEGELIKVKNEAEARKQQYILEGQGEAEAIRLKAQAYAESIATIANSLSQQGGLDAAKVQIAKEYIQMYGIMGSQSNTMLFTERPGDVTALLAQAALVLQGTSSSTQAPKTSSVVPPPLYPGLNKAYHTSAHTHHSNAYGNGHGHARAAAIAPSPPAPTTEPAASASAPEEPAGIGTTGVKH